MPERDRFSEALREVKALVNESGGELTSRQVLALLEWTVGELANLRQELEDTRRLASLGTSR